MLQGGALAMSETEVELLEMLTELRNKKQSTELLIDRERQRLEKLNERIRDIEITLEVLGRSPDHATHAQ